MDQPRSEYPRPQFVRPQWLCLNGTWQFEIDAGDSGLERGLRDRELAGTITVPFCPESALSGVGHVDFMNAVWYRKVVEIPAAWDGREVLLHFGAVDYETTVWVNGSERARHRGGFTPFTCTLAGAAGPGQTATIVVRARDGRGEAKAGGKQSVAYANSGCHYTRTTGIWQTVWLEPVPAVRFGRPRITPDVPGRRFRLELPLEGPRAGCRIRATLSDAAGAIARAEVPADQAFTPQLDLAVPADRLKLWGPGEGHLYDIALELVDAGGAVVDAASTYAGMRSIVIDGMAVRINGGSVFQRLVLDQGYYPDGIMTAPTDEALRRDIELSLAAGFNGARLHQKVFEERFLYHADRMGYLVWGEFGDWGCSCRWNGASIEQLSRHDPMVSMMGQWAEALQRDYSHPCIVGWCPLNETHAAIGDRMDMLDDLTRGLFLVTKNADRSRPVLDASGYAHRVARADVWDSHDYSQDVEQFRRRQGGIGAGEPFYNSREISVAYGGQPYFCSEFGGIRWTDQPDGWGYGEAPATIEEFYARFEGLCAALLDDAAVFGYCYTQLTDVFQEQNGLYRFDRTAKFDLPRLRAAQGRTAAIERR
ncbi:MAG: beta-galactosidase [Planctomycetes bacterium]|nr:beta-galactosidase [Planctomycetota bacterium]